MKFAGAQQVFQGFLEMKTGEIIMFEYVETSSIDKWFKAGRFPSGKTSIAFGDRVIAGKTVTIQIRNIRSFWGEDLL